MLKFRRDACCAHRELRWGSKGAIGTWRVQVWWELMQSTKSRKNQLMRGVPGLTWSGSLVHHYWVSLDLHHRSIFSSSEMCEFCSLFVGKCVLPSRMFWRLLWQMTVFPKHTDPGQFIWARKVLPAEHAAVNIIRPWLKDNWSNLDFDCEFCVSHCVVVVMISNYFYSIFKLGCISVLHWLHAAASQAEPAQGWGQRKPREWPVLGVPAGRALPAHGML